jgi:hypothetical protein
MRGRIAVGGKLRDGIRSPEAMKFEAWELIERDGSDGGVFGEDGLAGGVAGGDDTADVHGGSWIAGVDAALIYTRFG